MTMPRHALGDQAAFGQLDRSKQRRRTVTPRSYWQAFLRAVERLDLTLLIARQDEGVLRRIQVLTDRIDPFLDELWIVRELERLGQMRFELVCPPDALDHHPRHAELLGQRPCAPVGADRRLCLCRGFDNLTCDLIASCRRTSSAWGQASRQCPCSESLLQRPARSWPATPIELVCYGPSTTGPTWSIPGPRVQAKLQFACVHPPVRA
jgi:hypothetical protein